MRNDDYRVKLLRGSSSSIHEVEHESGGWDINCVEPGSDQSNQIRRNKYPAGYRNMNLSLATIHMAGKQEESHDPVQ